MWEEAPGLVGWKNTFEKYNKNKQSAKKEQEERTSQQIKLCFGSQNYRTKVIIAKSQVELDL